MLSSLTVRNLVLIEALDIQFQNGFCALTGETGAGKSILLDSLGLALGARSDASLIRHGAPQAGVTAEFQIEKTHPVHVVLAEQGLESGAVLILRRSLSPDGRSRAFINDQPVSTSLLRSVGENLVEIHSQFETRGLLDPGTHRDLLDSFAGLEAQAKTLSTLWQNWREAQKAYGEACAAAQTVRADEDYLRHAVTELQNVAPTPGEEEKILATRESLKHREQILAALDEAWNNISGENGAEMATSRAARSLTRLLGKTGPEGEQAIAALDRAAAELQDAVMRVQTLQNNIDNAETALETLEDRLYALRGLARKHQCRVDDLPAILESMASRLSLATRQDDLLAEMERAATTARSTYKTEAEKLSAARIRAAEKLDKAVARELPPLKLEKARFLTALTPQMDESRWGADGMDDVRFLVATNPGAEPGPLGKIASGGEMARFMLAIKVVMAATGAAQTLVFDEVDSGIGGSTAAAVGERLARLAKTKQILVVTHSPQVAARAAHHWIVEKAGNTQLRTNVTPLPERAQRAEEIARMLSGATITEEARAAAHKLLDTGT